MATHNLTPHQASFVLERALAEKKISAADVKRYRSEMHEEISRLQERLTALQSFVTEPVRSAVAAVAKKVRGGDPPFPKKTAPKKTSKKASGTHSQQIQGQYLGFLRQIPENDRPKFQTMAKEKSREDAIAAMKKALGK